MLLKLLVQLVHTILPPREKVWLTVSSALMLLITTKQASPAVVLVALRPTPQMTGPAVDAMVLIVRSRNMTHLVPAKQATHSRLWMEAAPLTTVSPFHSPTTVATTT